MTYQFRGRKYGMPMGEYYGVSMIALGVGVMGQRVGERQAQFCTAIDEEKLIVQYDMVPVLEWRPRRK